jgi:DNA-binding NtrC family response regulator
LSVGANETNDLVLQDPFISSRHLKLILKDGKVWIFDLLSTNGVFLNGVRVREAEWEVGAVVKAGQCQLTLLETGQEVVLAPEVPKELGGFTGNSPAMKQLYRLLERIGPTEATVLLLGESGTGKEVAARAVHQVSQRAQGPFVALNCGAISPELMESELFGHEKGAFTGAARRHEGAFGQARGGTLFLDEIGELPLDLQPKLLRVLENKSYRMVGGSEEISAEVRVVAATHRDLADLVKNKRFREDLFFRLFVFPVYVSPLREHLEDLSQLCLVFLQEFSPPGQMKNLSEEALKKLRQHDFPGNVRELRNVLLRAVILAEDGTIRPEHIVFPEKFSDTQRPFSFSGIEKLEDMERKLFLKALKTHGWNKAKAAESLGVAKSTLFAKIKLYELENYRDANSS